VSTNDLCDLGKDVHRAQAEQRDRHQPVNVRQKKSPSIATKNIEIDFDRHRQYATHLYSMERLLTMFGAHATKTKQRVDGTLSAAQGSI
jgi:hypothetical protein